MVYLCGCLFPTHKTHILSWVPPTVARSYAITCTLPGTLFITHCITALHHIVLCRCVTQLHIRHNQWSPTLRELRYHILVHSCYHQLSHTLNSIGSPHIPQIIWFVVSSYSHVEILPYQLYPQSSDSRVEHPQLADTLLMHI